MEDFFVLKGLDFSSKLSYLLSIKMLSAYSFSKETGISQASISRWLDGSKIPSRKNIITVAKYFDLEPDILAIDGNGKIELIEYAVKLGYKMQIEGDTNKGANVHLYDIHNLRNNNVSEPSADYVRIESELINLKAELNEARSKIKLLEELLSVYRKLMPEEGNNKKIGSA